MTVVYLHQVTRRSRVPVNVDCQRIALRPGALYRWPMTGDNAFGVLLKRLRESAGLTQAQAATAVAEEIDAGFTESYWNKLERGVQAPSGLHPIKLVTIASVVGASAEDAKQLFNLASEEHARLFDKLGSFAAEEGTGLLSLESHIDASTELELSESKAALKRVLQGLKDTEAAQRPAKKRAKGQAG